LSSRMDATHQRRVRPLRHSPEHVAGNDVVRVGDKFGPLPVRILTWAEYEVS